MGITTIFAKASETAAGAAVTSRFAMECGSRHNLESFRSVANDTNSCNHNHHHKGDRDSNCGRRDSATRNGSPKDQHVHGHGSPAASCGPRYKLESFQSVANESAEVGTKTTFAKATEAATVGEMTPRLAMGSRVFSRVPNVVQLLCLENALIPKGKEEVRVVDPKF